MPVNGLNNVFNYAEQLPEVAKIGMAPLNALYSGMQSENLMRSQANQLQGQEQDLATGGLQAAVAQAQNTPQGIATLASGSQGQAQSQAAKGAFDAATGPAMTADKLREIKDKTDKAEIERVLTKFQKAYVKVVSSPAGAGVAGLDEDVKAYLSAHPGDPAKALQDGIEMLSHTLGVFTPEAQAKLENTNAIVAGREKVAGIQAEGKIDAAKIRAEAAATKGNTQQLSIHEAAQRTSENNRYQQGLAAVARLRQNDPESADLLQQQIDVEHRKNVRILDEIYSNARSQVSSQPAAAPNKADRLINIDPSFQPTPDQAQSIANAKDAVIQNPAAKGEIIKRLKAAGIQVKE